MLKSGPLIQGHDDNHSNPSHPRNVLYVSPACQGFSAFCKSIMKTARGARTMLPPNLLNGEDSLQTIRLKKIA